MSAPSGSPPPPPQQQGCSNCLGIPDNPYGRPRMMLNMDLIESSSDSDDVETLDSLSELDGSQNGDDSESSSPEDDHDSGQGSATDSDPNGHEEQEDEYDRIFNRGLSGTSSNENSADEETDESHVNGNLNTTAPNNRPATENPANAEPPPGQCAKRRSNDNSPSEDGSQSKSRRL